MCQEEWVGQSIPPFGKNIPEKATLDISFALKTIRTMATYLRSAITGIPSRIQCLDLHLHCRAQLLDQLCIVRTGRHRPDRRIIGWIPLGR